jgi:hypothetical protein
VSRFAHQSLSTERIKLKPSEAQSAAMEPVRLRQGLVALPLDNETIVFCEADQRLVGLNVSASAVFHELQSGTPASELSRRLIFKELVSREDADQWVAVALDVLGAQGLIAGPEPAEPPAEVPAGENRLLALRVSKMPPFSPMDQAIERRYRLLQTRALFRFGHPAQARLVDSVLGHLACEEAFEPTVVMEIQALSSDGGKHLRSRIYRDGQAVNSVPRLSHLGPFVKGALWQTAINNHDFQFYIHSGVVGTGETCILLPAAAGSGKSSLTAALTHAGYLYFSDEVALIERKTFRVPPMPLAICSKSTGWEIMQRYYPDLHTLPIHRRDDGKLVRYIPPPSGAGQRRSAPVSHIIFPRYQAGAASKLERLTRPDALGRLMAECMAASERFDLAKVRELIDWIAQIECFSLTFSSLDEAVALVKATAPS